jgi:hypothetical protein
MVYAGDALRARHASRQAVFCAVSFFWLDGFAVPVPAQVSTWRLATQTVGQPKSKTTFEEQVYFLFVRKSKITFCVLVYLFSGSISSVMPNLF